MKGFIEVTELRSGFLRKKAINIDFISFVHEDKNGRCWIQCSMHQDQYWMVQNSYREVCEMIKKAQEKAETICYQISRPKEGIK